MNTTAELRRLFLCGSFILLTAMLWHASFVVSLGGVSKDAPPDYWLQFLMASVVIASPWMLAAALLWFAWRAEATASSSTMDPPGRRRR